MSEERPSLMLVLSYIASIVWLACQAYSMTVEVKEYRDRQQEREDVQNE
jgi:hypothetical protein